ncbi:MAG: hypothetical protein HY240_07895 [Actinobacteria bacterium]|nr:hypothetical protein [Actinomycetota bacterium]
MDLAAEVNAITPGVVPSPWKGFEHVRGWGIFGAPFSSGHVLALRVFPQNDFAPFRTLWHRTPEGDWSIHYDGPLAETTCPRYYGAAARANTPCRLDLIWTGPMNLTVEMDRPRCRWEMEMATSPMFTVMSAMGSRIPERTWRSRSLHRVMERAAKTFLRLGSVRMSGTMPNGQYGVLSPRRMYPVVWSRAEFDGVDLGHIIRSRETPRIGDIPVSARAVLAIGRGYFEILDPEEHARTKAALGHADGA